MRIQVRDSTSQINFCSIQSNQLYKNISCGYSVKSSIEASVARYFKVGISISVQTEHSMHVNMRGVTITVHII